MNQQLSLQDHAACKDKGTDMFFADEGPISDAKVRSAIAKAVSICNLCPVQDLCLMVAVNNSEEYGIWGGFTSKERKKIFCTGSSISIEEAKEHVLWKRKL